MPRRSIIYLLLVVLALLGAKLNGILALMNVWNFTSEMDSATIPNTYRRGA